MIFNLLPVDYDIPPTIYAILNSIVNYNQKEQIPIRQLAKNGRDMIFNFDYPLTASVSKEEFEVMILQHFMMRRIGFDTITTFQIYLENKLNEIMPHFNQMFDYINQWNYFNSGEKITTISNETTENNQVNTNQAESSTSLNQNSTTINSTTEDHRYSELPNNQIEDVKNGSYVTEFNYNQNNSNSTDNSESTGTNTTSFTDNKNINETNNKNETIERSPADKMETYLKAQNEIKNVYSLIFKELECLFFQII